MIRLTIQFYGGSISVMNGSVKLEPYVRAVNSPKKIKIAQRVAMAAIKLLLNSSGSLALARTGITIPIPS